MYRFRTLFLSAMIVGLLLPGFSGSASAQDASLCEAADAAGPGAVIDGYTVVLNTGRSGHEIVLGYGGAYLSGGSGHDVICAWGGGNTLDGNSGNDVLIVMEGTGNTLIGGSGNDTLIGYVGDVFDGGSGRNEIVQNEPPVVITPSVFIVEEAVYRPLCQVTVHIADMPAGPVSVDLHFDAPEFGRSTQTGTLTGPDDSWYTPIPNATTLTAVATYTDPDSGVETSVTSESYLCAYS